MKGSGNSETALTKVPKDDYIQFLRGLAAAAVVCIHVLAANFDNASLLIVRPFLNFCVALFVFLSGYLTPREKCDDLKSFYKRRIAKIVVPFLLWSFFYLVITKNLQPKAIVKALLLGGASSQMYYLLVYLQLVLITPLLYRWLDGKCARMVLWCVTPACLIVRYVLTLAGLSSVNIRVFCGTWLVYYLAGLEWSSRIEPALSKRGWCDTRRLAIVVCACIVLQWIEGAAWLFWGNDELAITHMRFSAMFTSLAFAAMVMTLSPAAKARLAACHPIVLLGDLSFGIYLCHIAPIKLWAHFLPTGGAWFAVEFVFVLGLSMLVVAVFQRWAPKWVCKCLGF